MPDRLSPPPRLAFLLAALLAAPVMVVAPAAAQTGGPGAPGAGTSQFLHAADYTRIGDPKLPGGGFDFAYQLDGASTRYDVTVILRKGTIPLAILYQGRESGGPNPKSIHWDGLDSAGKWLPPDSYTLHIEATNQIVTRQLDYPVDVVRLGITSIAAESTTGLDEWQMVYFMKNGKYAFYATPATGEYVSTKESGDLADLDLDDGTPRPSPAAHTKTDEPVLEPDGVGGFIYEDDSANYPVCYRIGVQPQFTVTFGTSCTDGASNVYGTNYPVAGYELRAVAVDPVAGAWTTSATDIVPGGTETLIGPALTALATRTDVTLDWRWEYRATGASLWSAIPGSLTTAHRVYTNIDTPKFAPGANGTQYSGPWVEISEYLNTWSAGLGIPCDTPEHVVETLIKGFFGQNGPITTAIEGVHYDCPSEGGDGGATHYHDWNAWVCDLTHLLNAHANGKFVNCTDCASSTTATLAMLGIKKLKMMRLGSMTLRAIWGIGTAGYTLDLWGNGGGGGHGFSYHHIITRDGGVNISDACLCVDEDGNPDALPGTPGWNFDRDWNNYEALVAHANVTWQLDPLPRLK